MYHHLNFSFFCWFKFQKLLVKAVIIVIIIIVIKDFYTANCQRHFTVSEKIFKIIKKLKTLV